MVRAVEKELLELIESLRLSFCRKIFTAVREREGSLSAMEVFSLEVIRALGKPTISGFARFTGISRSNASYKVQSLMKKGYLERQANEEDRREFCLELTPKFYAYNDLYEQGTREAVHLVAAMLTDTDNPALLKELRRLNAASREGLAQEMGGEEQP